MIEEQLNQRTILIPVDHDNVSQRSLAWYINYMMKPEDQVHVLNVAKPNYKMSSIYGVMKSSMETQNERMNVNLNINIEKGKELVQTYINKLMEKGCCCKGYVRVNQKVGEAIADVCTEHQADFIILSKNCKGFIKRGFHNGVSSYLLKHSDRPLVIIPPLFY